MRKFLVNLGYTLFYALHKPFMPKPTGPTEHELNLTWGTRGKYGDEPLKTLRLKDCDDGHLIAILATQRWIPQQYKTAIHHILSARGYQQWKIDLHVKNRAELPTFETRP